MSRPQWSVSWRVAGLGAQGRVSPHVRSRTADDASAARSVAITAGQEALAGEVRIALERDGRVESVTAPVYALDGWDTSAGRLPRVVHPSCWDEEDVREAARWRLLAQIATVFAEAASLGLAGRAVLRELHRLCREALVARP